ncbi:hydroxyacid dehydrogenase [Paenarthrobacter sp. Z7-10]|uniref:NAD(P)-dependent oxidoreductase n=1 Tax=Paenarthrobacter sp. Z7-10 TaxID=2787635 RepID=UPI0022A94DA9|nr:NAD(P)-dependent oxidoreductase [Paenarthrobacter sp. Z7-10]MCZ2401885.1 hydroxyacid dehydrogenase [Paenarthrobacter sp. Z7-10]
MTRAVTTPDLAIVPGPNENLAQAAAAGGGNLGPLSEATTGLIVGGRISAAELSRQLTEHPGIGWVQLPSAGIEAYAAAIADHPELAWTSAKGTYARPVAEHVLALTLALLRRLPERVRASSWGTQAGVSLFGAHVVVLGAGGIAIEIIRLFRIFGVRITVVRNGPERVVEADRTISMAAPAANADLPDASAGAEPPNSGIGAAEHGVPLGEVLADADVVVVAAALTAGTRGMVGAAELGRMKPGSVLINIARGALVDTDALVQALAAGALAGAGLDVTDPEPLPDRHPLWAEPNALITPHTANTQEMARPLIAARVQENVRRWAAGEELEGLVDPAAGY